MTFDSSNVPASVEAYMYRGQCVQTSTAQKPMDIGGNLEIKKCTMPGLWLFQQHMHTMCYGRMQGESIQILFI